MVDFFPKTCSFFAISYTSEQREHAPLAYHDVQLRRRATRAAPRTKERASRAQNGAKQTSSRGLATALVHSWHRAYCLIRPLSPMGRFSIDFYGPYAPHIYPGLRLDVLSAFQGYLPEKPSTPPQDIPRSTRPPGRAAPRNQTRPNENLERIKISQCGFLYIYGPHHPSPLIFDHRPHELASRNIH